MAGVMATANDRSLAAVSIKGRLIDWQDDKGYGFVEPIGGGERAFVHIKAFVALPQRPVTGDVLFYQTARDQHGRLQAVSINFSAVVSGRKTSRQRFSRSLSTGQWLLLVLYTLLLGACCLAANAPLFGLLPAVLSVLAYASYAADKTAAQQGRWRRSEQSLHLLSLAGGWPGALYAQVKLRHKSSKRSFQLIFWLTVLLNWGLYSWLLQATQGQQLLQQLGLSG